MLRRHLKIKVKLEFEKICSQINMTCFTLIPKNFDRVFSLTQPLQKKSLEKDRINKIKLSRGEICVANFKAPCEWCEFGQVFNGQ